MRENLCNENELNESIAYYTERNEKDRMHIKQLEEDIINGIKKYPRENKEIIHSRKGGIVRHTSDLLNAKYSIGLPCKLLEEDYNLCIPYVAELNLEIGYINIIQYISMGILLGIPKESLQIVVDKMDEADFNDILFDFIVCSYGLKRSVVSNKLDWGKPYDLLLDVIKEAEKNTEKASKMLSEYIEKKWIEGHADCGWKTFHKEPGYVGLWSYEAGAVAKILNLNDSSLIKSNHYPYELVHYRNDIVFERIKIENAQIDTNLKAVEEYTITNCPELDCIIPNSYREYINQVISDYNDLNDEDFWQKYKLQDIWFTVKEFSQDRKNGILGSIIINLLVNKNYIFQLDGKEDIEDYFDDIKSLWNCDEKIVEFDLLNDQIYLAKVPRKMKIENIYEVKIINTDEKAY